MLNNLAQNLTPTAEGFIFSWLILVVLIAGIWALTNNRVFLVNRLGKLSLGLGFMGAIYSLIKSFTTLGSPNIDSTLKGNMLAGALDASMAFVVLGLTVFGILVVWDMFKHRSVTTDVLVARE